MKNLLLFFLVPLLCISQKNYVKNDHVIMNKQIQNENYVIKYSFKDHSDTLHQIELVWEKTKTDDMINKFGVPYSIFEDDLDLSEEGLKTHTKTIQNGLCLISGVETRNDKEILIIGKDKKALVEYYSESVLPISNYILKYLQKYNRDTRQNRIEMAMKLVQDIPYGVPKKSRKIFKNGYMPPPEVFLKGYGDCDSKTILFVCIMRFLISEEEILFVSTPGHLFSAIKSYNHTNIKKTEEYIPQTQRQKAPHPHALEYKNDLYFICETSGPGRPDYGETNATLEFCYIEEFDLDGAILLPGGCYHSQIMKVAHQRSAFEHHSCYIFNPPTHYEFTQPF